MIWKRRHTVGVIAAIIATAVYFYFFHRVTDVKDANDWHVEFSYLPFHCSVCLGRVEELTYRGATIAIPQWSWRESKMGTPLVQIQTPVGKFSANRQLPYWKQGHVPLQLEDVPESIEAAELAQGWYDATGGRPREYYSGPYIRKAGTPEHWCFLATADAARWVAPETIAFVSW